MRIPRHRFQSARARQILLGLVILAFMLLSAMTLVLYTQFHKIQTERAAGAVQARKILAGIEADKQKANAAVAGLSQSVTDLRNQVDRCSDLKAHAPGCTVPVAPPASQTVRGAVGAPGAPGVGFPGAVGATGSTGSTGLTGAPGSNGVNGSNGADGPPGPPGPPGQDGANGAPGQDGSNGQPPFGWTYTDALGFEHSCSRVSNFDPSSPQYTCN